MGCPVHDELQLEWKWLVLHDPGTSNGEDSLTVKAFWEMVEHRRKCPVCREEDIKQNSTPPSDAPHS